ncbi:cadmium resistance transporter [Streptomyces sp. M2CJ-2]|uniref:cadmium resistance transporter n=1 Tax=Streptomyces sp. M2CJ-2 TaxID=2803948 RepID=UPI00192793B6|nr:cadmium resistance transporter [Streptomyces sp. M2CJ-2]MBL3670565.1 cadmium resistance transporter [Streptomyces sp. M2CJ-2]
MDGIFEAAATAAGMFAGTNIDDILVLTVLFLASRATGRPTGRQIWIGQYLGFAVLLALSTVAALMLVAVPDRWLGLLGLVPLVLGMRGLVTAAREEGAGKDNTAVADGVLSVAGVTVAVGADNVSVYTPVFHALGVGSLAVVLTVFAAGIALWCLAGAWLGTSRTATAVVQRHGQWIIPAVFASTAQRNSLI